MRHNWEFPELFECRKIIKIKPPDTTDFLPAVTYYSNVIFFCLVLAYLGSHTEGKVWIMGAERNTGT
jgi:hypothetical protein